MLHILTCNETLPSTWNLTPVGGLHWRVGPVPCGCAKARTAHARVAGQGGRWGLGSGGWFDSRSTGEPSEESWDLNESDFEV